MLFPIDVIRHVRVAYLDLPGLSLTVAQAARLFDVDRAQCAVALGALVDAGVLARAGEHYVWVGPTSTVGWAHHALPATCDCRWANRAMSGSAALWPDASAGTWMCTRDGAPRTLDVRKCRDCPRWDPRLTTRRRAHEAEVSGQPPARSGARAVHGD